MYQCALSISVEDIPAKKNVFGDFSQLKLITETKTKTKINKSKGGWGGVAND